MSFTGVRCSARVQEKQEKLRRETSPSKQIICDVSVQIPGTSSTTTVKPGKNKPVFPDEFDVLSTEELAAGINLNTKNKRKKRNWELWSLEDKQLFFEALNEHGKDFDAIQNYFATKFKPKNKVGQFLQPLSKNKDQVRHFYYRTWNKISKYLHFPKDMKKAFQELYGLVNYGELRKKLRVLNSKTAVKLCELVEKGTTAIKVRGKTFRIKTPVCRALKRLNRLEDIEHSRVPCKISLELIPKNGKAWAAVQSVSHNPRVKLYAPLQRTLASVITYFEDKWKSKAERLKQEMAYTFGGKPVPRLRFFPLDKSDINLPIFKLSENTSSAKISLRSYTENVLSKEIDEELELCTKKLKRRRKQSDCLGESGGTHGGLLTSSLLNGSEAYDSQAEADASDMDNPEVVSTKPGTSSDLDNPEGMSTKPGSFEGESFKNYVCTCSDDEGRSSAKVSNNINTSNADDDDENECTKLMAMFKKRKSFLTIDTAIDIAHSAAENQGDTDEGELNAEDDLPETNDLAQVCSVCSSKGNEAEDMIAHVWDDETILRGWTAAEAGVMTVGELYLMMGKCEKLCFEYSWDQPEEIEDRSRINRMLDKLIGVATSLKKKKTSRTKSGTGVVTSVSSPCSNCGYKEVGISPIVSQHVSVQSPTFSIPIRTLAPNPHLKVCRVTTSDLVVASSSTRNNTSTVSSSVEPAATTDVFPTQPPPVAVFHSAPKSIRTILPCPISKEVSLSPVPVASNKSNKTAQSCDSPSASSTLLHPLTNTTTSVTNISTSKPQSISTVVSELVPENNEEKEPPPKTPETGFVKQTPVAEQLAAPPVETSSADSGVVESVSTDVSNSPTSDLPSNSSPTTSKKLTDEKNTESTFRKPSAIIGNNPTRTSSEHSEQKTTPPKPFLDLPKGNRRLGRKPNWKRMVIPRELPLLPKFLGHTPVISLPPGQINTSSGLINISGNCISESSILIPIGSPVMTLSTIPSDVLVTSIGNCVPSVNVSRVTNVGPQHSLVKISPAMSSCSVELLSTVPTTTIPSQKIPPTSSTHKFANAQKQNSPSNYASDDVKPLVRNFPVNSTCKEEKNICDEILNVKSISSSSFDELIKVRQKEAENVAADMESNLSLSSFMEISLPESTKLDANEFSADRFLDMGMDESINSNLSMGDYHDNGSDLVLAKSVMNKDVSEFYEMEAMRKAKKAATASLHTPKKNSSNSLSGQSQSPPFQPHIQSFLDTPWPEPADLSLSSLLGTLEPIRSTTAISESEFQSMLGDSSQSQDVDFTSKFSEIMKDSSTLSSKTKK